MNTPENLYQEEITEDFKKIDKCILCGSSHIKNIYLSRDRHYGIKGEFTIDQCESCKLVFLNPMPTEEYLTSLYPKEYYAYQEFHNKSSALKSFYRNVLVRIRTKDPKFAKPGRILDVGCGSGLFLYKMKQEGWEVYGVEVNESAARLGNEAEQLNIHVGDLVSTNYQPDFFDYVRSNHSFEHIGNPHEVLNEIHRILKPDGKLFIGVPNFDSFNSRLFKKYWWYLCPPVHTFNYSVSNLKKMLENHGFEVDKVQHNGDFAGILGSFQIYMNRRVDSNTTSKGAFMRNKMLAIVAHRLAKLLNLFKTSDVMEIIAHKKAEAGK